MSSEFNRLAAMQLKILHDIFQRGNVYSYTGVTLVAALTSGGHFGAAVSCATGLQPEHRIGLYMDIAPQYCNLRIQSTKRFIFHNVLSQQTFS